LSILFLFGFSQGYRIKNCGTGSPSSIFSRAYVVFQGIFSIFCFGFRFVVCVGRRNGISNKMHFWFTGLQWPAEVHQARGLTQKGIQADPISYFTIC
jgi:hypothetical protein